MMSRGLSALAGRTPEKTIGDMLQWIEGDNSQQTEYQRTRDGIHRVSGFESSIRANLFVDFCKTHQVNGMAEFGIQNAFTLAVSHKELEVDDQDTHLDIDQYGDKLNELEIVFPGECTTIKSILGGVATCSDFQVEQYTNTLTIIIHAKSVSCNDLDVILDIPLVYGINLVPKGMHVLVNRRHCSQKGGPIQFGEKRRERIQRLASPIFRPSKTVSFKHRPAQHNNNSNTRFNPVDKQGQQQRKEAIKTAMEDYACINTKGEYVTRSPETNGRHSLNSEETGYATKRY